MPHRLRSMTQFPLLKLLYNLAVTLHFASVDLLIGGLVIAAALAVLGKAEPARMIVRKMPSLMEFVVYLALPPLLMGQMVYGRAFNASLRSGAFWFAVIALIAATYFALSAAAKRAERQVSWAMPAAVAFVLILAITFLYSNTGDPAMLARWLFFMIGAFPVSGAALALWSLRPGLGENTGRMLRRGGGAVVAGGVLMQAAFADLVYAAQPKAAMESAIPFACGWIGVAALLFVVGLLCVIGSASRAIAAAPAVVALLNVGAMVMIRGGIRDFTLRAQGIDPWSHIAASNWTIPTILLIGVGLTIGLRTYVAAKARSAYQEFA